MSADGGRSEGGAPVVIVGAGPAGMQVAQELQRRMPARRVVVFGAEPHEPYDRVRLSSALAGECAWEALCTPAIGSTAVASRFGSEVVAIDRERCTVRDRGGHEQAYSALVLATGSVPHVPNVPGTQLPGVYTFRNADDAQKLLARRVRSRRTVVLGGGLLGLEAARAMRRFRTEVRVVEHADRLMPRQLDAAAAAELRAQIEATGVHTIVGDGVVAILGADGVAGVRLRSGTELDCDTVIVATGIVPNVALARGTGLAVARGVRVDDRLRTSDPRIYAVGECAEHRGTVYGLVAPCLEQAAIAAAVIAGADVAYRGSVTATRLKVLRIPVFGAGVHPDEAPRGQYTEITHRDPPQRSYRKLVLRHGRLHGVLGVGEWSELPRALEAVQQQRRLSLLERWRFLRTGRIWPTSGASAVARWPANAIVCNCAAVTRGALSAAIADGCRTADALAQRTRASTVCGSCKPLLADLLGTSSIPAGPAPSWRGLLVAAVAALLAAAMLTLLPGVPYVPNWETVQLRWDLVWRDGFWKQVTGYALLAFAALGLTLSLRKRWTRFALGGFSLWRLLHAGLGLAAVAALFAHTGGRLGSGLNAGLMGSFVAVIAAGGAIGTVISLEHRLVPALAKRLRQHALTAHVLVFAPLPVMLLFHVLKIYYF